MFTVIGLGYLLGNIRIAGIDLPAAAAKLAKERGLGQGRRRGPGGSLPVVRAYRVPADMVGKTVSDPRVIAGP
jgi:putative transport protein